MLQMWRLQGQRWRMGGGRLRVSPYARITPKPMLEYNKVVCKYVLQLQWP